MTSRSCQGCNLCCIALEIESRGGYTLTLDGQVDLAKPAGVPCRFVCESGCTIYENRAPICRRFRCDWLEGRRGAEFSPLQSRIIGVRGNSVCVVTDPQECGAPHE